MSTVFNPSRTGRDYLTVSNIEGIAEHLRTMLIDKRFALVSVAQEHGDFREVLTDLVLVENGIHVVSGAPGSKILVITTQRIELHFGATENEEYAPVFRHFRDNRVIVSRQHTVFGGERSIHDINSIEHLLLLVQSDIAST